MVDRPGPIGEQVADHGDALDRQGPRGKQPVDQQLEHARCGLDGLSPHRDPRTHDSGRWPGSFGEHPRNSLSQLALCVRAEKGTGAQRKGCARVRRCSPRESRSSRSAQTRASNPSQGVVARATSPLSKSSSKSNVRVSEATGDMDYPWMPGTPVLGELPRPATGSGRLAGCATTVDPDGTAGRKTPTRRLARVARRLIAADTRASGPASLGVAVMVGVFSARAGWASCS
jgi:hypothetical protein